MVVDEIGYIEDMGEFVVFYRFNFYGYYVYFFLRRVFRFLGIVVWFVKNCYYLGVDYVWLFNFG